MDRAAGKCNACHFNAGANGDPAIFGPTAGNLNFNTGVENLPDQPADLTDELVPPDDGFGTPGDGSFNTPPLVEAADTGPFFHNGAVLTLEGAVAFYDGDTFNDSPAGRILASLDPDGAGIRLDATQIEAIAAFLRVVNALENIRQSLELLEAAQVAWRRSDALGRSLEETGDAIRVLAEANLHPDAVVHLEEARQLTHRAAHSFLGRHHRIRRAIGEHETARDLLVEADAHEVARAQ